MTRPMEKPGSSADIQKAKEAEASNVVQTATNTLTSLRDNVNALRGDPKKRQEAIDAANANLKKAQEHVANATSASVEALKAEIVLLPKTIQAMPEAMASELPKTAMGVAAVLNVPFQWAKNGMTVVLEKMGDAANKIGETMHQLWNFLKPTLAKFASIPGFKYIVGEKNATMLEEWLGKDDLQEQIRLRLPAKVELIPHENDVKAGVAFNDRYDEMLAARGIDASKMTKIAYFNQLLKEKKINIDALKLNDKKIRTLTMDDIALAAQKFNESNETLWAEEKKKTTPPITPTVTPAAPAAATPSAAAPTVPPAAAK